MTRTSVQRDQKRRRVVQKNLSRVQGSRPFAFEHGDLLSEGEDFEGRIGSTAEEDAGSDEQMTFVTCRDVGSAGSRAWTTSSCFYQTEGF